MRWLRSLVRRGVAAYQQPEESQPPRREAYDRPAITIICTQFGRYYLETNTDPLDPPGFMFGAM